MFTLIGNLIISIINYLNYKPGEFSSLMAQGVMNANKIIANGGGVWID